MTEQEIPGRFALVDASAKDSVQIPADWVWRTLGNLHLATDPQLPVLDVRAHNGRAIGWLIGYPINPTTANLLRSSVQVPPESDRFEQELYQLGGRFAAIIATEKSQRYYPDAASSLAAFLSSEKRIIASTPSMIRGLEPAAPDLVSALQHATQASGTWYPLGFSAYRNASVILPNHYVDLQTWTAHRHWSGPMPEDSQRAAKLAVREIFDTLRSTIAVVSANYPLAMDLTGGHDSRMMLAAALPYISNIEFRTNLEHSPADRLISESLSRFFGLHHNSAVVDSRNRVLLRGYGGEVGRCFYWHKCPGDKPPTAEQLLQGLGFPDPHEAMLAAASHWLACLPKLDRETILDLAYIEQRLGTTMSHVLYNSDTKNRYAMFPLNHRGIYARMMSLPHPFRRQQRLSAEICRLGSPLLNLFPVNSRHFIGLTKYKKYGAYLWRRRSMSASQREIVRNYCTRGRSFTRMLRDDLLGGPVATPPNKSAEFPTP